jgi:hypothetical protein
MSGFNIEPGLWVVIVAMVIFYLRLEQLRGKKKRLEKEKMVKHMRDAERKHGKVKPLPPKDPNASPYQVTSWILVIIGLLLMLLGIAARTMDIFPALLKTYWWVSATLGVVVFLFCFKVEV